MNQHTLPHLGERGVNPGGLGGGGGGLPKKPLLRSSGILSSGILEQRGKGNMSQRGQAEISRRVLAGSNKEHEQELDTPCAEAQWRIYTSSIVDYIYIYLSIYIYTHIFVIAFLK